ASQMGSRPLPFVGAISLCIPSVIQSPAAEPPRPFRGIMVDSIIERLWHNISQAAPKTKTKSEGGWYAAAQTVGPCRRLMLGRAVPGVGRRHPRHPVQGRSLG